MSSPASTPSRRRGKRGRGSNPPTRKCFGDEVGRRPEPEIAYGFPAG